MIETKSKQSEEEKKKRHTFIKHAFKDTFHFNPVFKPLSEKIQT